LVIGHLLEAGSYNMLFEVSTLTIPLQSIEMKLKMITDTNLAKTRKGGSDYIKELSDESAESLLSSINNALKYDFGYKFRN